MLGFEEFRQELLEKIPQLMPDKYSNWHVETKRITKMNGERMESFSMMPPKEEYREGTKISPVIYIENLYEEYLNKDQSVEVFLSEKAGWYAGHIDYAKEIEHDGTLDESKLLDPEKIFPVVINAEKNADYLKNIPHREILDLAVYYKIDVESLHGTITINDGVAAHLGLSEENLYERAMKNMEGKYAPKVIGMCEMLGLPDMGDEMFKVITNEEKTNGANAILMPSVFEQLAEKVEGDLYVIPSSIHEVLVLSNDYGDPRELSKIILQVNQSEAVSPQEWLSDNLYKYNSKDKVLEFAFPDEVKKKEKPVIVNERKKEEVKVI